MINVIDCMEIFWNSPEGSIQVNGIYFYGLFGTSECLKNKENLDQYWIPYFTETEIDSLNSERFGNVLIYTIRLDQFPDEKIWIKSLENTLRKIVDEGACVSWCGAEDCSWAPEILNPTLGGGNIYAGFAKPDTFLCHSNLNEECIYLNESDLRKLNNSV